MPSREPKNGAGSKRPRGDDSTLETDTRTPMAATPSATNTPTSKEHPEGHTAGLSSTRGGTMPSMHVCGGVPYRSLCLPAQSARWNSTSPPTGSGAGPTMNMGRDGVGPRVASLTDPLPALAVPLTSAPAPAGHQGEEKDTGADEAGKKAAIVAKLVALPCDAATSKHKYRDAVFKVLSESELVAPGHASAWTAADMVWNSQQTDSSETVRQLFFRNHIDTLDFKSTASIDVVCASLRSLTQECRAFASEEFAQAFATRRVGECFYLHPLVMKILGWPTKESRDTHLIGGASGSGKTMVLVGFGCSQGSGRQTTFPVLFNAQEITKFVKGGHANPAGRNANFRQAMFDMVVARNIIPPKAMDALQRHAGDACPPITVVFGMDEAGGAKSLDFVRAMSALVPADVHSVFGFGDEVSVQLVACGTGVGGGRVLWGSLPSAYTVHYVDEVGDESKQLRRDIYDSFLRGSLLKPLFDDTPLLPTIESNSRMAAVCGSIVSKLCVSASVKEDPSAPSRRPADSTSLVPFDARSLLPLAAHRFKQLNGLSKIVTADVAGAMIAALRQHLFPFLPIDGDQKEATHVKYGLVVDMSRLCDAEEARALVRAATHAPVSTTTSCDRLCEAPPAMGTDGPMNFLMAPLKGRYDLPVFTTSVLANLSGMPALARSVTSGDTLEEHWLCASLLAACAAGSPELFSLLLDENKCLSPLTSFTEEGSDMEALRRTFPTIASRLKAFPAGVAAPSADKKTRGFLISDLQSEGVFVSGPRALDAFVSEVEKRLLAAKGAGAEREGSATRGQQGSARCRIAAFRSPAKLAFADTILFVNDTLYVSQAKDTEFQHWTEATLAAEHVKMGGGNDEACPHASCLRALKEVWLNATGILIDDVVYCFVTKKQHTFGAGSGNAKAHAVPDAYKASIRELDKCKFIVTEGTSFLAFDGSRFQGKCMDSFMKF